MNERTLMIEVLMLRIDLADLVVEGVDLLGDCRMIAWF